MAVENQVFVNLPIPYDIRYASNGKARTYTLLYEASHFPTEFTCLTMRNEDFIHNGQGFRSIRTLYLDRVVDDPTEYKFAMEVFGDWEYWLKFKNSVRIKPFYEKLQREAEVKLKSVAIEEVAKIALSEEGRSKLSALKILLDRGWMESESVAEKKDRLQRKKEEEVEKMVAAEVSEDMERLGFSRSIN